MNIGIIGMGNMGRAIYERLIEVFGKNNILVCDRHQEKIDALGVSTQCVDPQDLVNKTDVIILAVKPQSFGELLLDCSGKFVISIMAGIPLARLSEKTKAKNVVRSMPNLPAKIGHGATLWVASDAVKAEEKSLVKDIFFCLGNEFELADEAMIDGLSAISGCGPAYFFYLTELLEEKARVLGLSPEDARALAEQTFVGAALVFDASSKTAREWREAVSSKGGVTLEAIGHLQKNKFDQIFFDAMDAAKKRSQELSQ